MIIRYTGLVQRLLGTYPPAQGIEVALKGNRNPLQGYCPLVKQVLHGLDRAGPARTFSSRDGCLHVGGVPPDTVFKRRKNGGRVGAGGKPGGTTQQTVDMGHGAHLMIIVEVVL